MKIEDTYNGIPVTIITKKITASTNMDEVKSKVEKILGLLEEANSLIQELASDGLEVHLDV